MPISLQRLFSIALVGLAVGLVLRAAPAMAIEEPHFQQVDVDGDFSLRTYDAVIVAETDVDGTLDEASSTGFRRLAGYIFGGNHPSATDPSRTTSDTMDVKTKIAMTAPVTTQELGTGWTVSFTMPGQYTLANLPIPDDARVKVRAIPALTAAVISFSGWVDGSKVATKTALLQKWMAARGLIAIGEARLARYNPPWTLPFLRRNEILIPCRKPG